MGFLEVSACMASSFLDVAGLCDLPPPLPRFCVRAKTLSLGRFCRQLLPRCGNGEWLLGSPGFVRWSSTDLRCLDLLVASTGLVAWFVCAGLEWVRLVPSANILLPSLGGLSCSSLLLLIIAGLITTTNSDLVQIIRARSVRSN